MKTYIPFLLVITLFVICTVVYSRRKLGDKTFILCYHKINYFKKGGLKSLFVRPGYFNLQMMYLKWRGYRTISLSELSHILKSGADIPRKVFVITFDDGYKDNYLNAYPILKKYNFRATIFLTVDNIGKKSSYPGEPQEEHLSVDDIKNSSDVFDFGSHTLTHPDLSKLNSDGDKDKLYNEVVGSKQKLIKFFSALAPDKKIETFCYPFGRYNESAVRLASEHYSAACTTKSGLVSTNDNPYLLKRIEFKDLFTMSFRDFFKVWDFYLKILLGV